MDSFFGGVSVVISIHALRGEGDMEQVFDLLFTCFISIHALRGEGDKDE